MIRPGTLLHFGVIASTCSLVQAQSYKLAYWYEVGGQTNANCSDAGCGGTGNHSVHTTVFDNNGARLGNKRVTNENNSAQFGITNTNYNERQGYVEIPLFINDGPKLYVQDSTIPSERTPVMIENRAPTFGHYSWECGFIYVPPGVSVTFDTAIVGTLNSSSADGFGNSAPLTKSFAYYDLNPLSWPSDAFSLDQSSQTFGQTFVANGNRVVAAKFEVTNGALQHLQYGVLIRQGGPTGALIGAPGIAPPQVSDEYFTKTVYWPLEGNSSVPVVPGQTYFAQVFRQDVPSGSFNIWKRNNNVYPSGQMYRGSTAVAGNDLFGRIVCATVPPATPFIQLSKTTLSPATVNCNSPGNDQFTVTNGGKAELNYTIAIDQPWLRVVPNSGTGNGEPDVITVEYHVGGLSTGPHTATITVSDPNASNSPKTIAVTLNVTKSLVPGDLDGDCDVDMADFGRFQACYSGSGVEPPLPACALARLDSDADVDLSDFGIFQTCLSGAGIPGNPNCGK